MSTDDDSTSPPQSMRQKQILDIAAENPDASIAELAAEVPTATPDLVERVFDEHGDPAATDDSSTQPTASATSPIDEPDRDAPETSESDSGASATESVADEADETESTADEADETESTADEPSATETDDDVPSATETVQDEAENASETAADDGTPTDPDETTTEADPQSPPEPDALSPKQRAVLDAIARHPDATQQVIADELDVSSATISKRANSIPAFDWTDRATFVENVLDDTQPSDDTMPETTTHDDATDTPDQNTTDQSDLQDALEAIHHELDTLDDRLHTLETPTTDTPDEPVLDDPELVHKIAHACMNAENITEDEELRILQALLS